MLPSARFCFRLVTPSHAWPWFRMSRTCSSFRFGADAGGAYGRWRPRSLAGSQEQLIDPEFPEQVRAGEQERLHLFAEHMFRGRHVELVTLNWVNRDTSSTRWHNSRKRT